MEIWISPTFYRTLSPIGSSAKKGEKGKIKKERKKERKKEWINDQISHMPLFLGGGEFRLSTHSPPTGLAQATSRMDGRTDGRINGQIDRQMDRWMDKWRNGWMDKICLLCSTGRRPLSGPLPCLPLTLAPQLMAGQGYRWPLDAFRRLVLKCLSIAHRSKGRQKRNFWKKKNLPSLLSAPLCIPETLKIRQKYSTVPRARERVSASEASSAEQANEWAVRANEQAEERVARY